VDAAVLVPNCPVCHQTISLVARHLEANGISTIVMGCAKDIVEYAAVAAVFCSAIFRSATRPASRTNPYSQGFTMELALRVLETAPASQTTVQSPAALERRRLLGSATTTMSPRSAQTSWHGGGASSTPRRKSRADCARSRRRSDQFSAAIFQSLRSAAESAPR